MNSFQVQIKLFRFLPITNFTAWVKHFFFLIVNNDLIEEILKPIHAKLKKKKSRLSSYEYNIYMYIQTYRT